MEDCANAFRDKNERTVVQAGISGRFSLDILLQEDLSVIHGFPSLAANAPRIYDVFRKIKVSSRF